jgi:tetratricopeptide (TPR) repeat protein
LVDRDADLQKLDEVLSGGADDPPDASMLLIVGTAGVGKTSLAVHWAHRAQRHFPDGQLYADLRGYDPGPPVTPQQVLENFLPALGVPRSAIPAELEARAALYRSLLAGRRMLVLLDNAANVGQVRPLLPGTAGCLVVVTSRNRLSGLIVRNGARRITLDTLPEAEAVELLRSVTAPYRPHDDRARLAELARLCACLPLALRIAAERAASRPWMSLDELITDLRNESDLWDALTTEDGETDAVRSVFAWSYRALPEDAARLFRLLGLHPGPDFGTQVVVAMTGMSTSKARRLLDVLIGAHLLEQTSADRYRFHDLLRYYAADQAHRDEPPENRATYRSRALRWYLLGADAAQSQISPYENHVPLDGLLDDLEPPAFTSYVDAARWVDQEHGNLPAATRVAAETGAHGIAWRLAVALRNIYMRTNHFANWITTSEIGLASARQTGDRAAEADLLESLGMANVQSHRLAKGAEYHHEALRIRHDLGDQAGEALSLNDIGLIHLRARHLTEAETNFRTSMSIFRERGDAQWEAVTAANLAEVETELEHIEEATTLIRHALDIHRARNDDGGQGNALHVLSALDRARGDLTSALRHIEHAVDIAQRHENLMWEGYWLLDLGNVQLLQGRPSDALTTYQRAATLQRRIGDRTREALAWNGTGETYQALERFDEAAHFHRLAATVHREFADHWHLAISLDALARAELASDTPDAAREHWEEARALLSRFHDPHAQRLTARIDGVLRAL